MAIVVTAVAGTGGCPWPPPQSECATGADACSAAAQCNDSDPCTTDICEDSCCEHLPVECDDGLFCTGTESCDRSSAGCVSSGPPCDPSKVCSESMDACVGLEMTVEGCPSELSLGDTVELHALTVPAEVPTTYRWELVSGSGLLGDASLPSVAFTATQPIDAAIQATVTVDQPGVEALVATETCFTHVVPPDASALRRLPSCIPSNAPITVAVEIAVPDSVVAVGLREAPPDGWLVSSVSDDGGWDSVHRAVKWFFVGAPSHRTVNYTLTPPDTGIGVPCFNGLVNLDGSVELPVGGETCVGSCSDQ